jgi:hydroxymethylglutaryl-CoA reductase
MILSTTTILREGNAGQVIWEILVVERDKPSTTHLNNGHAANIMAANAAASAAITAIFVAIGLDPDQPADPRYVRYTNKPAS